VVLGAGLAGLAAAMRLPSKAVTLVEREETVGGKARTHRRDGFTFDVTGHWLHLRDTTVRALVQDLLAGEGLVEIGRRAKVWIHDAMVPYPLQANIHGLPGEVRRRCLAGFLRARAGRLIRRRPPPESFDDFVVTQYGQALADHFFTPYYTKFWGLSCNRLTSDWLSGYFPTPSTAQVVGGALGLRQDSVGYNTRFLYPAKGGIDLLPRALLEAANGHGRLSVRLSTDVDEIDLQGGRIKLTSEPGWLGWRALVSTIPLPDLLDRIPGLPPRIAAARRELRSVPLRYLNVALRAPTMMREHWVYVPEGSYPFYRMGVFTNAVPEMAPPGCAALWVEIADRSGLLDLSSVISGLERMGAIGSADDVLFVEQRDVEHAYVVFDDARQAAVDLLLGWLAGHHVFSCGRYGGWAYGSMEDAILDGFLAASRVMAINGRQVQRGGRGVSRYPL
jgi:protoporphyrinogen oxidase